MQPSLRNVKLKQQQPEMLGAFVAPCATVVGQVRLGAQAAVFYGAILRGDVSSISIGEGSSLGDRVMVHCSSAPRELPARLGKGVTVGAGCILHGCDLGDFSVLGEGVQVLGPAPAPLALLRGRHRRRLLLKTRRDIAVQPLLREWLARVGLAGLTRRL